MVRLTRVGLLVALTAAAVVAPAWTQERSPTDDLIFRARRALNDLEYARADSIARSLLDLGSQATPRQRITGLQLLAAALYPEERAAQRPDSARRYLVDLVRATPDAEIPRAISWPGLDSMLTVVRATTFAVWATPRPRYELSGPDTVARIPVSAARPAVFRLTASALGDANSIVLDSAGPAREAVLSIPALSDDHPVLPWGQYTLRIVGTDASTGEPAELTYPVSVDAPPLLLHQIPTALDSSQLRAERAPRRPVVNVLLGVALGAATAFAATAVGGSDPVGASSGNERAYLMGAGMTLGALVGALADRGAVLRDNVDHNDAVREAFASRVRQLREENQERRTRYRATITIGRSSP